MVKVIETLKQMSRIKELNFKNYEEIGRNEKGLFIVQFFSETCEPCKAMSTVIDALLNKYPNINFYKVDSQKEMEIAHKFEIRAVPTIVFCEGKDEIYRKVGTTPLIDLQYIIDNIDDQYFRETGEFQIIKKKSSKLIPMTILFIVFLYGLLYFFT